MHVHMSRYVLVSIHTYVCLYTYACTLYTYVYVSPSDGYTGTDPLALMPRVNPEVFQKVSVSSCVSYLKLI